MVSMAPTMGYGLRLIGERFDLVNTAVRFHFEESLQEVIGHPYFGKGTSLVSASQESALACHASHIGPL